MATILTYQKIGFCFDLWVGDPAWERLAEKLQSCALVGRRESAGEAPETTDLAWVRTGENDLAILLRQDLWLGGIAAPEGLYLQTDHLLDGLARERAPQAVFLHAGAVVSPGSAGLVISGNSGAGKTSLVTACITRGWQWLSDETLCFESTEPLTMRGLKRNFNLKRRSFPIFPELAALPDTLDLVVADRRGVIRFFNPESLGPQQHLAAARLDHFVFPEYDRSLGRARLEPIPQREAAENIAAQLQSAGATSFGWLASAARRCPAHRLRYHDPRQAVDLLATLPTPART